MTNIKRDLIDALPRYYDDSPEVDAIMEADAGQIDRTRQRARELTDQFYVRTATQGLSDWERVLDLPPRPNASLYFRRNRILARLNGTAPATVEQLTEIVNAYIEDRSAEIVEHNDEYTFLVDVGTAESFDMTGIISALDEYKPAHLDYALRHTRSNPTYYASALLTGEQVTIYPWHTTELTTSGFSRLGGAMQSVERISIEPK